jgi:hypothetical protein
MNNAMCFHSMCYLSPSPVYLLPSRFVSCEIPYL